MDYLLTYTLVGFVQSVLHTFLSPGDARYVALVASALSAFGTSQSGPLGQTRASIHKVAVVLLVNSVMSGAPSASLAATSAPVVVLHWMLATATVVLLPTLLSPFTDNDVFQQVSSLVFFMYAENSSFITESLHQDHVLAALAILVLHAVDSCRPSAAAAEKVVLRALSMLATNVVVSSLLEASATSTHDATEIGWLFAVIILFDNVRLQLHVATELKDYAVWKGASLISERLAFNGVPLDVVCWGCLALVAGAHVLRTLAKEVGTELRYGAVVDLGILVAVNAGLSLVKLSVQRMPNSLVWMALLGVVNVVHLVLSCLQSKKAEST